MNLYRNLLVKYFKIFFFLIIILTIFKGLIPIVINTSEYNNYIYNSINLCNIFFLVFFCILNLNYKDLKNNKLIILNFILSCLWLIVVFKVNFNLTYLVFFITHAFFIIYLIFLEKNKFTYKEIYILFIIITFFYSIYYIYEFYLLNGLNLFIPDIQIEREINLILDNKILDYNIHIGDDVRTRRFYSCNGLCYAEYLGKLVNDTIVTHTHTMGHLGKHSMKRPIGLIDLFPHASAYLFSVLNLFWLGSLFQTKSINKKFEFFLFLLTFFCLIASSVSSIIVSYISIILIFACYIFLKKKKKYSLNILIFIVIWISLSYSFYISFNFNPGYTWIKRLYFTSNGWNIFTNGFDEIESFKELILPSLFGFAKTLELSKIYNTEFALLKLFFEKGIFAFSVLMLIFINPLYKCFKNKNILSISSVFLPSLMFFGGLLHYGVSFKSELILLNLLLFSYIRNTNE
jgi:hypothetical protein